MKTLRIFRNILILLLLFVATIIFAVRYSAAQYIYSDTNSIPETEIGLILGAAVKDGRPLTYLKDRLDKGIELYENKKVSTLLISGDDGNDRSDEISVMHNYLIENGIPEDKIISDSSGYNTYASMYRVKNVFKPSRITVITQKYHLARAVFICRKLGVSCYGTEADKSKYTNYIKHNIREYFATVKVCFDLIFAAKPAEYKH